MVTKYIPEYQAWYSNLSDDGYRNHYYAWLKRDAYIKQQEVIRSLLGNKHFPLVYDLSYGGGELSQIISHDVWLKSAIDDRQEALIHEITPSAEIRRTKQPLDISNFAHTNCDLILAINVVRNLDIKPAVLRNLWCSEYRNRNTLFDVIMADDKWIGLNDRTFDKTFFRRVDGWQILPRLYHEFPQGVRWYMCYYSADEMNWLPSGKQALLEQNKHITEDAVYSVIEHVYTNVRGKHILDLSKLGLGVDTVDDILNIPILRQHYDIILGLGLLSRIEQYDRFVQHIISHTDADVYIFSGIESDEYMPKRLIYSNQVGGIEHTYRQFSRLNVNIKREFNYNSYVIRGANPKEFMERTSEKWVFRGREVYIVVEASYQLPETIARTVEL